MKGIGYIFILNFSSIPRNGSHYLLAGLVASMFTCYVSIWGSILRGVTVSYGLIGLARFCSGDRKHGFGTFFRYSMTFQQEGALTTGQAENLLISEPSQGVLEKFKFNLDVLYEKYNCAILFLEINVLAIYL